MEKPRCIVCENLLEKSNLGYVCNTCKDRFRGKPVEKPKEKKSEIDFL